jgi:VanZ family protein
VTAIFILSSIPGERLPDISFRFGDKAVHLFLYFLLMIFTYISFSEQNIIRLKNNVLIFSFLFTVFYGFTDEIHQYFVPNRFCDFYDILADAAGAAAGAVILLLIKKGKMKVSILNN